MIFGKDKNRNKIFVNGKSYSGNSIVITENSVIIDGVAQEKNLSGIVSIKVEGDVANLSCNAPTTIHGDVHGNVKVNGSLTCGNISGDVKANGSMSFRR